jgi:hypothetical protein
MLVYGEISGESQCSTTSFHGAFFTTNCCILLASAHGPLVTPINHSQIMADSHQAHVHVLAQQRGNTGPSVLV